MFVSMQEVLLRQSRRCTRSQPQQLCRVHLILTHLPLGYATSVVWLSVSTRVMRMHTRWGGGTALGATPVPEGVLEVVDRFPHVMDTTPPADRPPPLHSVSLPFIDNPTPYYRGQFRPQTRTRRWWTRRWRRWRRDHTR